VPVTVTTGTGPSAVPSSLAPGAVFTTTVTRWSTTSTT